MGAPFMLLFLLVVLADGPGPVLAQGAGAPERQAGVSRTRHTMSPDSGWATTAGPQRQRPTPHRLQRVGWVHSLAAANPWGEAGLTSQGPRSLEPTLRWRQRDGLSTSVPQTAQTAWLSLAADEPAEDLVKEFVAGLASEDCASRRHALRRIFPKLLDQQAPFRYVPPVQDELGKAAPQLQRKLSQVLGHLESWATFYATRKEPLDQLLEQKLSREDLYPGKDSERLRNLRDEYLTIIQNPEENLHTRFYAAAVMVLAVRNSLGPQKYWGPSLLRLLRDGDPVAQMIAVSAVLGGVQREKVPKARLVAPLIKNLRDPRFSVRQVAQNYLEAIVGVQVCLDATDPEDIREPAIRQWEAWWTANRSRLQKERLK